jgi:hypothetical protein
MPRESRFDAYLISSGHPELAHGWPAPQCSRVAKLQESGRDWKLMRRLWEQWMEDTALSHDQDEVSSQSVPAVR